jgi:hypothetical protein
MPRDPRSLFVVILCGGCMLLLAVTIGPLAGGKPRPTELQPAASVVCPTCPAGRALLADAGPPVVAPEVFEVHDLATVKPADAARLEGTRDLYRVVIDGPADRQGDRDVYEVLRNGQTQGLLFLATGTDADGVLAVKARLVVIRHPVHAVGAVVTPAFVEWRLVEAERAGP